MKPKYIVDIYSVCLMKKGPLNTQNFQNQIPSIEFNYKNSKHIKALEMKK
jgi:hypothetical protein